MKLIELNKTSLAENTSVFTNLFLILTNRGYKIGTVFIVNKIPEKSRKISLKKLEKYIIRYNNSWSIITFIGIENQYIVYHEFCIEKRVALQEVESIYQVIFIHK